MIEKLRSTCHIPIAFNDFYFISFPGSDSSLWLSLSLRNIASRRVLGSRLKGLSNSRDSSNKSFSNSTAFSNSKASDRHRASNIRGSETAECPSKDGRITDGSTVGLLLRGCRTHSYRVDRTLDGETHNRETEQLERYKLHASDVHTSLISLHRSRLFLRSPSKSSASSPHTSHQATHSPRSQTSTLPAA